LTGAGDAFQTAQFSLAAIDLDPLGIGAVKHLQGMAQLLGRVPRFDPGRQQLGRSRMAAGIRDPVLETAALERRSPLPVEALGVQVRLALAVRPGAGALGPWFCWSVSSTLVRYAVHPDAASLAGYLDTKQSDTRPTVAGPRWGWVICPVGPQGTTQPFPSPHGGR
jgi:hypothetical protein